jgi:isovaleryl-CoA dehydrogenase
MGSRGITAFLIERGMAGFSVAQKLDKLGMRGSNTGELVFDNVEVPFENVLHEEGKGVEVLMSGLDYERTCWPAGRSASWPPASTSPCLMCSERRQFGQAIGDFQLVQGKLADMYTTMNACRAYVYAWPLPAIAARRPERTPPAASSMPPKRRPQMALDAIQLLGGNGYINDYPTGRLLRDAKLYEIGAGTSEIRRWLIGREMMAEDSSLRHQPNARGSPGVGFTTIW